MTPLRDAAESATAGVPVVRGLVWVDRVVDDEGGGHDVAGSAAQTAYPQQYWTSQHYEEEGQWRLYFGLSILGRFATEEQAKAAAQADCDRRTLSALNPDFLSALDTARAEIERLRAPSDVFWDTVASGPTDGQPMAMADFRAWAAIASKRIAAKDAALTAAQARIAELEGLVRDARPWVAAGPETAGVNLEDEFAARQLMDRIDATLSPAVKEPTDV